MQSYFYIHKETDDFIFIIDSCLPESKSVTNDAENVCTFLFDNHNLSNRRLFYRDTSGIIDEIKHDSGRFKGFSSGHDNFPVL